ncbi:MAG: sulfurtransferase TusA family protein [Sphingobium sp.]|jgi:tRNA 2-thiouridine synthesizing protein A|uniref:sulfurtransferase TusA family protein n=1 Tax=Sphingobium sp. TaxID=1912891 RepID=UPI000C0DF2C9|nr:sulfurtransferase TusA family protein [Sphingobium sp.]MBU0659963.1 sulfurtransferase TusA family protein [Alphaproteobacteria bacterium]MBA4753969.1 sulfurtransferase TusA family protein [Sphingobium sp.]MBS88562.1 redox protein [Sphingobium sp.]MBU0775389.1 sulfurtransferase TusA family protein [Alphaproteobacteria bacterium]MBU0866839.1 sulfurtransferase TusA family protein [Alphaproteobacteria bacterium]
MADPVIVNARGMKCPWPALRAARAMRDAPAIRIEADDPIAGRELEALARQNGWLFAVLDTHQYALSRMVPD